MYTADQGSTPCAGLGKIEEGMMTRQEMIELLRDVIGELWEYDDGWASTQRGPMARLYELLEALEKASD